MMQDTMWIIMILSIFIGGVIGMGVHLWLLKNKDRYPRLARSICAIGIIFLCMILMMGALSLIWRVLRI
jgi:hypothetical protein